METSLTPENLEEDGGLAIRQTFLQHPRESAYVDYKEGIKFSSGDNFSLKLVKHILGMANAGGGFIVIGYPENAAGHPEAGSVSVDVLSSYDVSTLATCVESYKSGTEKIDIKVHKDKNISNGNTYPIIEVGGFKHRPFFCKSTSGGILKNNALYIRVASARTIEVATPDEWDQLIDICVSKRQDETLRRFTDLMKEVGIQPAVSTSPEFKVKKNEEWLNQEREQARIEAKKAGFIFEGMEVFHTVSTEKKWNAKELMAAMEASALRNTGWPIGYVFHVPHYKPQVYKSGIRAIVADEKQSFDYWSINEKGDFYFFRTLQETSYENSEKKQRQFWFDTQIWRIAESMEHAIVLYRNLSVENTSKIEFGVNFFGLANRRLTASPNSNRLMSRYQSGREDTYSWNIDTSLDNFNVNMDSFISELSRKLFLMFDFADISESVVLDVIKQYRGQA